MWSVRDKVTGENLAFKVLAEDAGEAEVLSLVREAMALSGLEGLGVPRVAAFGALPHSGRRYMVRELVLGESLEAVLDTPKGTPWLEPLARASEQLTVLHRAGLLHGEHQARQHHRGRGVERRLWSTSASPRPGARVARGPRGSLLVTPRPSSSMAIRSRCARKCTPWARRSPTASGDAAASSDGPMRAALTKIADRATEQAPTLAVPERRRARERPAPRRRPGGEGASRGGRVAGPRQRARGAGPGRCGEGAAPGSALAVSGPEGSGKTTTPAAALGLDAGRRGASLATIEEVVHSAA